MTQVEIEYCVPCGMQDRAVTLQREILDEFGQGVEAVALVTGDSGIFEVRADGDVIFDKESDEYDVAAIVDAIGERASASA